jgi:rubrerythrin
MSDKSLAEQYSQRCDELRDAAAEADLLKEQIDRLRGALEVAQWGSCDGCGQLRQCPVCGASRETESGAEPHAPGCLIGKALRSE